MEVPARQVNFRVSLPRSASMLHPVSALHDFEEDLIIDSTNWRPIKSIIPASHGKLGSVQIVNPYAAGG